MLEEPLHEWDFLDITQPFDEAIFKKERILREAKENSTMVYAALYLNTKLVEAFDAIVNSLQNGQNEPALQPQNASLFLVVPREGRDPEHCNIVML
ncbi:MAG: hypothetical protein WAW86_04080 [Gammaproteobacteria bacterium]